MRKWEHKQDINLKKLTKFWLGLVSTLSQFWIKVSLRLWKMKFDCSFEAQGWKWKLMVFVSKKGKKIRLEWWSESCVVRRNHNWMKKEKVGTFYEELDGMWGFVSFGLLSLQCINKWIARNGTNREFEVPKMNFWT